MKPQQFCLIILIFFVKNIKSNSIEEYYLNNNFQFDGSIDISVLGSRAFGRPDLMSGEKLANWRPSENGSNAEEQGNYLEGDILFDMPQGRNAVRDKSKRWPNGIVYYVIEGSFSSVDLNVITSAMLAISSKTSITFVLRTSQIDYVAITSINAGCFSAIGKVGGKQNLNLQSPNCLVKIGTVIHELLHTIGFFHEHTRWERDNFVTIVNKNIISGQSSKFEKLQRQVTNDFGVTYNYGSVMHYSSFAYSSNGKRTIISKKKHARNMGQREGLSRKDILKIRRMYGYIGTDGESGESSGSGEAGSGQFGGSGYVSTSNIAFVIAMRDCFLNRIELFLSTGNSIQPGGFEIED